MEATQVIERAVAGSTPPGNRRAPTLEELRARRDAGMWARMPSGAEFLLRPPNMEMHALSGDFPSRLRRLSAMTAVQMNQVMGDDNASADTLGTMRTYMMEIVRRTVIEPDLSSVEDLDTVLIPADFHFLLSIANREQVYDADGRRLWGHEPLSRWDTFRSEHGCAEDCPACARVISEFSPAE
jgi:hypothetical protein